MLRQIEDLAELSVARGCGFAAIGILTFMVGMMGQPPRALQAGGLLFLMTCFVLWLRANGARSRPYKRTEVWVMLRPHERPQAAIAQQVIGNTLRHVYLRYALHAAALSCALCAASIVVGLLPGRI